MMIDIGTFSLCVSSVTKTAEPFHANHCGGHY